MERRTFLKAACVSAAGLAVGSKMEAIAQMTTQSASGTMPKRAYKPGIEISVIGFGGILVAGESAETSAKRVAEAIERGVNYFDVAPQYGNAEIMLGPALEPYRKNCFLACKSERRDAAGVEAEMKRSLERLRTDHFDLYQLHGITDVAKDVDAVFAKGGAMEYIDAAKKDGRVRHVGFSAHSMEAATAALNRYPFDSMLLPINFATFYKGNFGPQAIELARKKGVTCLALKALAKQKWPADHPERKKWSKCWYEPLTQPSEVELALRFTLSQRVAAAIPPGEWELFKLAADAATRFVPITARETETLKTMAANLNPIFAFKGA